MYLYPMNEIKNLFDAAGQLNYPDYMKKFINTFTGLGFFPIGDGTWKQDGSVSEKTVMVLGQDFDCESNYLKAAEFQAEDPTKNATWRNLLAFLEQVQIAPVHCFFTNAIMGIREGYEGTGKSPAFKDKAFIEECRKFFLLQFNTQKPELVLVLGKYVAEFLAPIDPAFSRWKSIPNFDFIDSNGLSVITVELSPGLQTCFVLLVHPSFRDSNVGRRKFGDLTGNDAEVAMVNSSL